MFDNQEVLVELNKKVDELNELIGRLPWCDFDFLGMSKNNLEIAGALDLFYPNADCYDIRIVFEDIFYMSSLISWHTDTSKKFLKILDGNEFNIMNTKHQVEQGNYVFMFCSIEDHEENLYYIIARDINYEIINMFHFEEKEECMKVKHQNINPLSPLK